MRASRYFIASGPREQSNFSLNNTFAGPGPPTPSHVKDFSSNSLLSAFYLAVSQALIKNPMIISDLLA